MISFEEAKAIFAAHKNIEYGTITVAIQDAVGMVLAQDIISDRAYPPFNRAAMDGIAIQSKSYQKGKPYTIVETVHAGDTWDSQVLVEDCIKIMTGAQVPSVFDAIIKIEDLTIESNIAISTLDEVTVFQHIARQGEDIQGEQIALSRGHRLTIFDIPLLATFGIQQVEVQKKPTVAIICTGDEIVPVDYSPILKHQIRSSNDYFLHSVIAQMGFEVKSQLVEDDYLLITTAFQDALVHADIIITSGGVSMGSKDYMPEIFTQEKIEKVFHKVAIKPGKPLFFGKRGQQLVIGMPGNPISTQAIFTTLIKPLLLSIIGLDENLKRYPLAKDVSKKSGLTLLAPCMIQGDAIQVKKYNGSGDVTAMIGCQGFAILPAEEGTISKNTYICFYG